MNGIRWKSNFFGTKMTKIVLVLEYEKKSHLLRKLAVTGSKLKPAVKGLIF